MLGKVALGVDVGSTSARARLYAGDGRALGAGQAPFAVRRTAPDRAEHDSEEIWRAVIAASRGALAEAGISAEAVGALGFDATCSLALFDGSGAPVGVSEDGESRWNVVMWADHRATAEAAEITATRHRVLDFVGGAMSPEMQMPKLLWLKRNLPGNWRRYRLALDLADFLVWRTTGVATGSACTLTCKWTYLNHEPTGWQADFLAKIGLADAIARLGLPALATQIGARAGSLTASAASALGLTQGIPVASGLIDAHAGGLGLLAGTPRVEFDRAIALIAGTSNCHMALSERPRPISGVWGPYFGAMMPGLWLNEGGQSATGAALDHVLDLHAEGRALGPDRHAKLADYIVARLAETGGKFASDMLVVPDFRGNRSPLADPHARAVIFGLDADASFDGLAKLYHATAVGIAYGTRHIVDAMNAQGYAIDRLHLTGGHSKGDYLAKLYADATGCDVVRAREPDAVTLGAAIAAAVAGGLYADFAAAGAAMCADGARLRPDPIARPMHEIGYRRFRGAIEARALGFLEKQ